jgi:Sporulation related domain.
VKARVLTRKSRNRLLRLHLRWHPPQWDLEVRGETPQAVSDLSGWLIEHSFVSNIVKENGKTRILLGPFSSKAEAEAKQTEVRAALTRAKKQNIELLVLDHPVAQ